MPLAPPKRPRFLDSLADHSQVETFTFANANGTPRPLKPPPRREAQAPAPPSPDVEEVRRQAMERVGDAVRALRLEAERLAEQSRADAIEVAFQVASRILESEVKANPESLFALVRSALRKAGDSRRIALRLCPGDAAAMERDFDQLGRGDLSAARVEIVADPTLSQGDCVVDTDFGQVDGRLATRLGEARRAVQAVVGGGVA
ncbi:MAG TPA: FliH/SctL family protein [Anaeromyxobacteraceae bacterium]|nr:FliH/SctL family protein [Anaeromyxobacteraceae bacterium]